MLLSIAKVYKFETPALTLRNTQQTSMYHIQVIQDYNPIKSHATNNNQVILPEKANSESATSRIIVSIMILMRL